MHERHERPVGRRAEAERSDWTEQDLLTVDEALPRLLDGIDEVTGEIEATADPAERELLERRLEAMHLARTHLETQQEARRA
ncbi:hypothetical protein GCM10022222_07700 [Amycolatopsis ultiminotia]|uniref:Uncharacterized protein n=2 Tax=Amycolatopsis ultiminotia TaxID=543629 RepID=A0ABP6V6N2_9PSEU